MFIEKLTKVKGFTIKKLGIIKLYLDFNLARYGF